MSPSRPAPEAYSFGVHRLEVSSRRLLRSGVPVALTPKALDTLLFLIENRHRAVAKAELMTALWPGQAVAEATLSQNVFSLRKALEDDADEPRYIATVPKHGYRFVAIVTPEPTATAAPTGAVGRRLTPVLALGGVLAAGILAVLAVRRPAPSIQGGSLVVIPFENAGASDLDYVSESVTEGLIHQLSRRPGLRVLARATAFEQRRRNAPPRQAGRDLGVDLVLTGRVLAKDGRAEVEAELVEVASGASLWTGRFSAPLGELMDVEASIAREVLGRTPAADTTASPDAAPTRAVSGPVYELYLKARYFWNKRTPEGLTRSIELFRAAVEREPRFARAWSGMADAYNVLPEYSDVSESEAYPEAHRAALQALALDDSLAEAHASLAFVLIWWARDWPAAEREFLRALELNPGYATAHHWYGNALLARERIDEGLAQLKQAYASDPLSLVIGTELGAGYYLARRPDDAVDQLRRTLELDDRFAMAHYWLGRALLLRGRAEEALVHYRAAQRLLGTPHSMAGEIGHALATLGRTGEAREQLRALERYGIQHPVAEGLAVVLAGLGEREAALAAIERAAEERASDLAFIGSDAVFDGLRQEPRFAALLARLRRPRGPE